MEPCGPTQFGFGATLLCTARMERRGGQPHPIGSMIERRRIAEMWRAGQAVALATLVRVEGSSYRRPGARLLVAADGTHVGSISGGCLEAEIVRKARWLTRAGAAVERYSTLFDDTAEIPYGLGCGGVVEVLLEPAGSPEFEALMEAMAGTLAGTGATVTTRLPAENKPMARAIVGDQGQVLFRSADWNPDWEPAPHPVLDPAPHRGLPQAPSPAEPCFTETLDVPQRLFVLGAGEDARPMVRFAALLGWSVLVMDGRPQWARAEFFPDAEAVCATRTLGPLRPGSRDAVILMSHSFEADREWLRQVLPCRPLYVGLLGARHRSALLVAEAASALGWPVAEACESLFSPVGLDLGGDGAEAIALSAIAEIQACVQGRLGRSRRMTAEAVAEQIERGGASRYLHAQCAL